MEAHQHTHKRGGAFFERDQPLGIPASQTCKALRMILHDLMFKSSHAPFATSHDEGYQWLAQQLKRPRESTHMSLFGLKSCRQAIIAVQTLCMKS
jgi:hypothetical protein